MDGSKITHKRDGRMKSYMVVTKITRPRDGRYKNNSSKEWTDGQLICRYQNKEIGGTKKGDGRMKR